MSIEDFDLPTIITQVVGAVIILLVTWIIAKVVKRVLTSALGKVEFLHRQTDSGQDLAASLASIGSLLVWLFGLMAILNLFQLTQVLGPIQDLLSGILGVLPGVIGAGVVFFVGLIVAKIARELVTVGLQTAGADTWAAKATSKAGGETDGAIDGSSVAADSGTPKISAIAGQLVYTLVLIVIAIAALQILGIRAIAEPATQMLSLILDSIPSILAAAILLGIGVLIARLVAPVLENTLRGLGADRALADLGLAPSGSRAASTGTSATNTPSSVIARVAQVAIVLFFAIAATRVLGFPEITRILDTVLALGGHILFGGAVIAAGVLVANLLARLVSGNAQPLVRYGVIGLFVAMGLQFMGVADTIVTLAFGSIVVGTALAAALAFGLGGRDAAARQLERLQARQSDQTVPANSDPTV